MMSGVTKHLPITRILFSVSVFLKLSVLNPTSLREAAEAVLHISCLVFSLPAQRPSLEIRQRPVGAQDVATGADCMTESQPL